MPVLSRTAQRAPASRWRNVFASLVVVPPAFLFPVIAFAVLSALCGIACLRFRGAYRRAYLAAGIVLCAISLTQFAVSFAGLPPLLPRAPFDW
ncbi:MAG: hypothetical protein QY323_03620 [Patescibacteria group bacterium]|nr:MAG: hypothetical protein QY323_03620 [Patescibacteria group bacterium]